MQDERITNNGNGLANAMTENGFASRFVKATTSPLGETYLFQLEDYRDFDKKKLEGVVARLNNDLKINFKLGDTKELGTHYSIIAPYEDFTLDLGVCLKEVDCREVVVGKDSENNLVKIDFKKIPHILIAGTTGSGKSVLLNNLLCNLIIHSGKNPLKQYGFVIIDPKNSFDLARFKAIPNIAFIDETDIAIQKLNRIVEIMENRYRTQNYEYELYIFIDELSDLMIASKFEVEKALVRLSQKGRECGIHIICATQYPLSSIISSSIKSNMPYRFCLKTATMRESITIRDKKGCETLETGQAIFKQGGKETLLKIALASDELVNQVIKINKG